MDQANTNPQQAILDRINESKNILVTVSADPTVDQLAACLGLTLWLNKAGKHATAVFSGQVPSTLEFLQPAETLEKNTDSLRDFIISLDKSKADKLRYKVEENVVKIFITPYRTSLSADDLEYSQGDFNVDMVIALGVSSQSDLDTAITAHGRILHDATVATITTGEEASELGSISWHDAQASSLSELVAELGQGISADSLDGQTATSLLTGIVAETARFSNEKTTPQTMSISAALMAAGANQQLVATELESPTAPAPAENTDPSDPPAAAVANNDGSLEITHNPNETAPAPSEPTAPAENPDFSLPEPQAEVPTEEAQPQPEANAESSFVDQPPAMGGTLTANTQPEDEMPEPSVDPLSVTAPQTPVIDTPLTTDAADLQPAPPSWMPPQPWLDQPAAAPASEPTPQAPAAEETAPTTPESQTEASAAPVAPDVAPTDTLTQIEAAVHSPHLSTDSAQLAPALPPIEALNAMPIDLNPPAKEAPVSAEAQPEPAPIQAEPQAPVSSTAFDPTAFGITGDPEVAPAPEAPAPQLDLPPPMPGEPTADDLNTPVDAPTMPLPNGLTPPPVNPVPPTSPNGEPTPPPVPPPFPFDTQR